MRLRLISILILFSSSGFAVELTGPGLLNKISLSLTGRPASIEDQNLISGEATSEDQKKFIESKIDSYMQQPEYFRKIRFRLYELFQFNLPNTMPLKLVPGAGSSMQLSSVDNLFQSLTEKNLSWDTLLTGKSYKLFAPTSPTFGTDSDNGFYRNIFALPDLGDGYVSNFDSLDPNTDSRDIDFDKNDLRVAGALTTMKFFSRYGTTGINKNRRRAAAIFRMFLCDKMSASIPAATAVDPTLYDLLYPSNSTPSGPAAPAMTQAEIKAVLNRNDQIHGTRTDCRACHYKLDPMGKVFSTSPTSVGSEPASGALTYKDSNGQLISTPVQGLGELAQTITQQPDYVKCQIQNFWNWYVGQDVALPKERMAQLQSEFEATGRRTNDFTKKLILSPEFANREFPNELKDLAKNVKTIFQKCQTCHSGAEKYEGTDLTKWPLGDPTSPQDNAAYWVKRISKVLDLPNMGLKRTMPPKPVDGGYIPSRENLEIIKNWIDKGAPDEAGNRQVNP